MKNAVLAIALSAAGLVSLVAQSAPPRQFEVATLKPTKSTDGIIGGGCHGVDSKYSATMVNLAPPLGRCVYSRISMKGLLRLASRENPNDNPTVVGGDDWTGSEAYDIEGKAENIENTTQEQLRLMIMTLLRDRFKLEFHRETREEQGYIVSQDAAGVRLTPATGEDPKPGEINSAPKGSYVILPPNGNGRTAKFRVASIDTIARFIGGILGRPVQEKTGLADLYDGVISWTPSSVDAVTPSGENPADAGFPSIITAVREQFGLRLESGKVPVQYLVIDHAEKPDGHE